MSKNFFDIQQVKFLKKRRKNFIFNSPLKNKKIISQDEHPKQLNQKFSQLESPVLPNSIDCQALYRPHLCTSDYPKAFSPLSGFHIQCQICKKSRYFIRFSCSNDPRCHH